MIKGYRRLLLFFSLLVSKLNLRRTLLILAVAVPHVAFAQFTDSFSRADAADLGNGWIEKTPAAFALVGGAVAKQAVVTGYLDNIVYRPSNEDLLDVEASFEFRLTGGSPGYPQIFTRVQTAVTEFAGIIDGYILYIDNDNSQAVLGRQIGASFLAELAYINLSPALNTTDNFRLRLRSTGTSPVALSAFIERWNGSAWDTIGQASVNDNSNNRINVAGSVGFGGYVEASYVFDQFTRTNLGTGSNPVPTLNSVSPNTVTEGGSAFSLTMQGNNFTVDSIARWNGSDRTTTYVSANQLLATISSADIATAGTASATVFTPAPGGGTSAAQTVTINPVTADNPFPILTSLNPASATEGSSAFALQLIGSDFIPGSVVRWNGVDRTTTFVSANELQATITAADIAAAGTASVTVFTPAPGGGLSAPQIFTIDPVATNNPVPVLTSLNPDNAIEGSSAFVLQLTGSDFIPASVVRWNGTDRATNFISANELQATITANDIAAAGTASVTVFTPAPGGGLSAPQNFTIDPVVTNNPVPVLTSLNPASATEGSSAFALQLTGSDFIPGSVVRWNGTGRATTFISANELQAAITATDIAAAGTASITVFTPSPGGGLSATQSFQILATGSGFTDSFSRADAADLGNGWIEKTPAAFALVGGAVAKQAVATGYLDNIVYRPSNEDLLDVEASFEFRLTGGSPGYPQIFTRVQTAITELQGFIDGYILYIDDNNSQAVLGRQIGSNFLTELAFINLSPALNTTDNFRLRLRSTGTSPVALSAFIERWNGSAWDTIGQASVNDNSNNRINVAGSVGFGGYVEAGYVFDQFTRTNLATGGNPVPTLNSVSPNTVTEGGSAFSLTMQGNNFTVDSIARWNGGDRTTTFVSANQLLATISSADIATAGTASATVFTPAPGGGTSAAQTVTINPVTPDNPFPILTSLNPASATEGGSAFALQLIGSDFIPGSVVRWNGVDRATTFVSANELQATITAADIAAAGTASVTVFTPAPGGGLSAPQIFTIDPVAANNPVPVLTSLNPDNAIEGSSAFVLQLIGSDFIPASVVRWDGVGRATTFISANELQATVTANDIAAAGTASVTVFTPAPGGGTSAAQTFTINASGGGTNPVPVVTSLFPESRTSGSGSFTLTILGSDFSIQSIVNWNGIGRSTNFISNQELQIQVNSQDIANTGVYTITVTSPAPGGGLSRPHPFLALPSGSTYFLDNFNSSDNDDIGNNWTEKNPAAFSLINGEIIGINTNLVYRDNIVYRPVTEDRQDVEVSVEFIRQDPFGFPQLHARAQRDSIATPDALQSYIFYIEDFIPAPGAVAFAVGIDQAGVGECIISQPDLPQALQNGERYRMTLRVTGNNPVQLDGSVEWFNSGIWEPFFSTTIIHDNSTQPGPYYCDPGVMPPPLVNGGAVGFSKWIDAPDIYDNFYWIDLTGSAAPPVITDASPDSIEEGTGGFSILITGSNFTPNSVVRWSGADRATTFVSSTVLQAAITAADIAAAGTIPVTVFTPPPGGGLSNTFTFEILDPGSQPNPVPTLTMTLPSFVQQGAGNTQLIVQGSGFTSGSIIRWNGLNLATTYISPTGLSTTVPASNFNSIGSAAVTVFNPTPGGGTSDPLSLGISDTNEFFDDFNRPDSADPGLGWTEKTADSYQIINNGLAKIAVNVGYLDNAVYRPASESLLDVETSVEFQLTAAQPGYPQLFTRLQPGTVALNNILDGYMIFVDDNINLAILGRQTGSSFVVTLAALNLSESLTTAYTYRMRMTTSGSNPVAISAYIERLTPAGFIVIGSASVNDNSPNRIQNPGISGVGGYIEQSYVFDNFRSRGLN